MSQVIGVHRLTLKEGVTGEALEQFFNKEYEPLVSPIAGLKISLLKGDRGEQVGAYLLLMEFDSVAARDRLYPRPGKSSSEAEPTFRLLELVTVEYTDYVEL